MKEDRQVQEGKLFAVLAYLSILCLIPLLLKKENKFAYHHGKQGLVIFIGEVGLSIVAWMPILGLLLAPIGSLIFFIVSFIGITQALLGNYWNCPVVSDIVKKINL